MSGLVLLMERHFTKYDACHCDVDCLARDASGVDMYDCTGVDASYWDSVVASDVKLLGTRLFNVNYIPPNQSCCHSPIKLATCYVHVYAYFHTFIHQLTQKWALEYGHCVVQ